MRFRKKVFLSGLSHFWKLSLPSLFICLSPFSSRAMMFYYSTELGVDLGSGTVYYDASRTSGNTDWNGANLSVNLLGTFNLKGGTVKLYRDDGGNYINGNNTQTIYYKIYQGSVPAANTFSTFQLLSGGSGGTATFLWGNDYEASNYTGNVNLISPITSSGSWNMAVYFDGNASWGSQNYFDITQDDRGGLYYISNISAFYGATGAGTQSGAFSGSGKFVKSGTSSTYTLNAANTYTGNTEIDQGTVEISGSGNLSGSSAIFLGSGTNGDNAQLTFSGSTASFANNITVNNSTGSGTRILAKSGTTAQTLSGSFTMNRNVSIDVTGTGGLTISGVMSGANTFTKTGTGTLTLSGSSANTFSVGTVTVSQGTLVLNKSANTAAIAGRPVDISTGAMLRTDAANQIGSAPLVTVTGTFDLNGNAQTIALAGAGTVKLDGSSASGTLTISNSGSDTFSGSITDNARTDGAVTKTGSGTQILSGASSYDGLTTISQGVLRVANNTALGSTTGATTVSAGAVLELSGGITIGAEALTLNGAGISDGGSLRNISGNNTWQGTISNNSTGRINSDADLLTISGNISNGSGQTLYIGGTGNTSVSGQITGTKTTDDGALFKNGSGTLTLSGDNSATLTGNIVLRAGTVSVANANSLGSGGSIIIGTSASATSTILSVSETTTRTGSLTVENTSTGSVVEVASTKTFTISGVLDQNGGTSVDTRFEKRGAGTLKLSGGTAGTYNGQIRISDGTLVAGSSGSLGDNTSTATRALDLGINLSAQASANNVRLDLANGVNLNQSMYVGANQGNATRTLGMEGGTGSATFQNETYLDGNLTLDPGASGTLTVSGKITQNQNAGATTQGIIKSSAGTVVLSGANDYKGTTTINAGTLKLERAGGPSITGSTIAVNAGTLLLGAANQIGSNTPITLNGGTLDTGGLADTVGKLKITAASTILGMDKVTAGSDDFLFSEIDLADYGTSGSQLTFRPTSNTTYQTGDVIRLSTSNYTGWSGYSTTSFNDFQNKVKFGDANLTGSISFGGGYTTLTVAAIPEPKVYVAAGALALLIGFAEVRRRKRAKRAV